jgi:hypothetical protein
LTAPALPSVRRTPRPQGAAHLRATEWADWLEIVIAAPPPIQLSKDGSRDLVLILRKAAAQLAVKAPAPNPPLPMTMATVHVPGRKRRPTFADDVPPQVRRLIWIKWLQQHLASERPYFTLSNAACAELVTLLQE